MKISLLNKEIEETITKKLLKKVPFLTGVKISDKLYPTSNSYDLYLEMKIGSHVLYCHNHVRDLGDALNLSGYLENFEMNFVEDYKNNDVQGYFIMDQLIAKEAYLNDRIITGIGYDTWGVDGHLKEKFNPDTSIRKQSIKKRVELAKEYLISNNIPITVRATF